MAEALKSFQQALELNPEVGPAHWSASRSTLADEDPPAAAEAANKALSIDPGLADAHLLLAQLDLDNTRYDAARERIDQVLKANDVRPRRAVPARSHRLRRGRAARRSTPRQRGCSPSTRRTARCTASPATSRRATTGSTRRWR